MNRGRTKRLIAALCLAGTTVFAKTVYAEGSSQPKWAILDEKPYCYIDGKAVTTDTTVNGIRYTFDSDGVCTGVYTGWASDGEFRYYYFNGKLHTGWMDLDSKMYYFNRDGKMRTGWVSFPKWSYYYHFDDTGVWDDVSSYLVKYRPENMNVFRLDFDYPIEARYEAKIGNGTFREFTGIQYVRQLLDDHGDIPLIYGEMPSSDERLLPGSIYFGQDDISIRCFDKEGNVMKNFLRISRDTEGHCYLYLPFFECGIRLNDDTAYDRVKKAISYTSSNRPKSK